jgi:hypothetical protein
MQFSRRDFISAAAASAASSVAGAKANSKSTFKSVSAMTFMPDGRLVIADWRAGQLIAVDVPKFSVTKETSLNVLNLGN